MRGLKLPSGRRIILSDTVGFIADLPTQLVAAFRATLEEVLEAEIILHVRDAAHDESEAQKADVVHVLKELGVEKDERRIVEVLNKIDLLEPETRIGLLARNRGKTRMLTGEQIAVSALTGAGEDSLLQLIDSLLGSQEQMMRLTLAVEDGAGLAWAHKNGRVVERRQGEKGIYLVISGDAAAVDRFSSHFPGRLTIIDSDQRRRAISS
jgi:GTP-binding protein HflX